MNLPNLEDRGNPFFTSENQERLGRWLGRNVPLVLFLVFLGSYLPYAFYEGAMSSDYRVSVIFSVGKFKEDRPGWPREYNDLKPYLDWPLAYRELHPTFQPVNERECIVFMNNWDYFVPHRSRYVLRLSTKGQMTCHSG